MKKVLKYLGIAVLALLVVAGGFLLFISLRGIPHYKVEKITFTLHSSPESIARGQKLANMLCANCHRNNETGLLTGKLMTDAPAEFGKIYSQNITQDPTYGIGEWTDEELVYLLRTGIKRDGQYAPPYMAKLAHMADEDINAIISFLRSDLNKAAAVADQPCEPALLTKFLCLVAFKPMPYPTEKIELPDTNNMQELGKYFAINLECFSCHSADFASNNYLEPEKSAGYFGGGTKTLNLSGEVILTANITPDKETGIGNWTKEEFVTALKTGQVKNGPALRYPMIPFTQLSDKEAGAIFEYLQTIPPIKHAIPRPTI
ncbi:c-type cytochrome [bacterium]|nr:c-type cytochrome [bacterium]